MHPETIVFYSWQSDLPNETNNRAIATCLKKAILNSEEASDTLKIKFDEATRGEAGSPEIPNTIFNKISTADIFVCDITTINQTDKQNRKTPNPNVLIELGYAVAHLGWERIVMLFNKQFGTFPADLPFDLDKRRITQFTIKDKSDKNGQSDLTIKLNAAIQTIINKNPIKPLDIKNKTEEEIERIKDIANLKNLFSCIHIETFDYFIDELPRKIIERIFHFWDLFRAVHSSTAFYIYDYRTKKRIEKFRKAWAKTLSYDEHFSSQNGRDYIYYIPMDLFPNEKSREDYHKLAKETLILKKEFKSLIEFMRTNYIEVDVDLLSKSAIERYIAEEKETLDRLES